jgi:alkylated DNA repair dioxygenase AlkB
MELFPNEPAANLLPHDGVVRYFGVILDEGEQARVFGQLMDEVAWAQDELVMFGKRIVTARKVAWQGDAGFRYRYSGMEKKAAEWTPGVRELKRRVEELAGEAFNSCLLNLYHHGGEGMGWHSDDEPELEADAPIASVSLGVERRFRFRHKESRETQAVNLEQGSLLVMAGETQRHWQHMLPKMAKVTEPRINLTFRRFG